MNNSNRTATLDGRKWLSTAQASVDSILGDATVPVSARGSLFFNKDRWTARLLMGRLVDYLRYGTPLSYDVALSAVAYCNSEEVVKKEIVIATVPDRIPLWLARSSVGGRYHEAWHTKYSCSRDLTVDEVWPDLERCWGMMDDPTKWVPLLGAVLHWGNLIEDIRIERCGCRDYPGSPDKMADLQDLILRMEGEGRESAGGHRALPKDDMSVVMGMFRDLGLGYDTPTQRAALEGYRKASPKAAWLVESGPLRPLLDRAIAMGPDDDLGHWWIAMEVVALLASLNQSQPQQPQPQQQSGEGDPTPAPPSDSGSDGDSNSKSEPPPFPLFKVGDRAKAKAGPLKGKVVEVTFASPPDENGRQNLKFAEVID